MPADTASRDCSKDCHLHPSPLCITFIEPYREACIAETARLTPRPSVGADLDAVVALCRRGRDIAGVEIALDQVERALGRRAIAAAAAGLDADEVAGLERTGILLVGVFLARSIPPRRP